MAPTKKALQNASSSSIARGQTTISSFSKSKEKEVLPYNALSNDKKVPLLNRDPSSNLQILGKKKSPFPYFPGTEEAIDLLKRGYGELNRNSYLTWVKEPNNIYQAYWEVQETKGVPITVPRVIETVDLHYFFSDIDVDLYFKDKPRDRDIIGESGYPIADIRYVSTYYYMKSKGVAYPPSKEIKSKSLPSLPPPPLPSQQSSNSNIDHNHSQMAPNNTTINNNFLSQPIIIYRKSHSLLAKKIASLFGKGRSNRTADINSYISYCIKGAIQTKQNIKDELTSNDTETLMRLKPQSKDNTDAASTLSSSTGIDNTISPQKQQAAGIQKMSPTSPNKEAKNNSEEKGSNKDDKKETTTSTRPKLDSSAIHLDNPNVEEKVIEAKQKPIVSSGTNTKKKEKKEKKEKKSKKEKKHKKGEDEVSSKKKPKEIVRKHDELIKKKEDEDSAKKELISESNEIVKKNTESIKKKEEEEEEAKKIEKKKRDDEDMLRKKELEEQQIQKEPPKKRKQHEISDQQSNIQSQKKDVAKKKKSDQKETKEEDNETNDSVNIIEVIPRSNDTEMTEVISNNGISTDINKKDLIVRPDVNSKDWLYLIEQMIEMNNIQKGDRSKSYRDLTVQDFMETISERQKKILICMCTFLFDIKNKREEDQKRTLSTGNIIDGPYSRSTRIREDSDGLPLVTTKIWFVTRTFESLKYAHLGTTKDVIWVVLQTSIETRKKSVVKSKYTVKVRDNVEPLLLRINEDHDVIAVKEKYLSDELSLIDFGNTENGTIKPVLMDNNMKAEPQFVLTVMDYLFELVPEESYVRSIFG
jgi:hypothetical protein